MRSSTSRLIFACLVALAAMLVPAGTAHAQACTVDGGNQGTHTTKRLRPMVCEGPGTQRAAGFQAMFISGLTDVLAQRAQQEVIQWFLDTVISNLCADDIKDLFPNLCQLRSSFGGVGVPSRTALVEAIRGDVEVLPVSLIARMNEGLGAVLKAAVGPLLRGARDGQEPLELLGGLVVLEGVHTGCRSSDAATSAVARVFFYSGLGAAAVLKVKSTSTGDIKRADVKTELTSLLALGTRCPLSSTSPAAALTQAQIDNIADIAVSLYIELDAIRQKVRRLPPGASIEEQLRLAGAFMDALADGIDELNTILGSGNPTAAIVAKAIRVVAKSMSGNFASALLVLGELLIVAGDALKLPEPVKRYLPLVTDLLNARTSADVATALEAAASPVGGWRLKRSAVVVSLGALVGASAGLELAVSEEDVEPAFAGRIFAPVGLDISAPVGGSSALGVFLPVIDLGNLVGARIADDADVKTENQPGFAQVFSPGVLFRAGLGNSPFVLSAGASYTPNLRGMEASPGEPENEQDVVQVHLGVAADIVLFPF